MKTVYRAAALARRFYWFVFRPHTRGVKCVIENDGRWLMIRNSYGRRHWTFPGGRVGLREAPEDAVRREVEEEVGIRLSDLTFIGTYKTSKEYKRDTVYCFMGTVQSLDHRIDRREVEVARWFPSSAIPHPRTRAVDRINALLSGSSPRER